MKKLFFIKMRKSQNQEISSNPMSCNKLINSDQQSLDNRTRI